jgi:ribonucrease Y
MKTEEMEVISMVPWYVLVISILLGIGSGVLVGYLLSVKRFETLGKTANKIIEDAEKTADEKKKKALLEQKQELHNNKLEYDKYVKEKKQELLENERKLDLREQRLDNRSTNLDKREEGLNLKESKLEDKKVELETQSSKVEELIAQQEQKLVEISNLSVEKAREIILNKIEADMSLEIAAYIKDEEDKAKLEVNRKAQYLLAQAIQTYANESVSEKTVSVVTLPNEEMKGRIIGREGRNIRAIESLTGVDLIIDDTPEAVVLSCFDPVRREIARRTLETLIADGRIQPPRIEEVVQKCTKELDEEMRQEGEKAVYELGIGKVHPELIKLIGRLKFRTSYGQNALHHAKEVAFLAGKLAVEIGEDQILARRAGLLHDIGKSIDHEVEGSHVDIGLDLATKYREPKAVIDGIGAHHGDKEPMTIFAWLVTAADIISAARPGARSESLDNYLKRLKQLEEITNEFEGVEKTYAIQAGREIRILVKPEVISDLEAYKLARDVKKKIEENLNYPGTIKVTVIRETRAQEIAK